MLSWFSRNQDSRQLPVQPTQWAVDEDNSVMVSGNDRLSGVTYASRDRKGNKEFFCSLPEGSEHAARAQQIASSIFSGRNGNSGTLIESSGSQRKLIGGTGQTGYVSPKRASSNGVRVRYVDTRGNESVGYAGEDLVNKADGRAEVTQMPEASRGFRHRGPTHTTFGLRSSSREMFVSAPNGSREAELHNRVATMGAEEKRTLVDGGGRSRNRFVDVE